MKYPTPNKLLLSFSSLQNIKSGPTHKQLPRLSVPFEGDSENTELIDCIGNTSIFCQISGFKSIIITLF